MGLSYQTFVVPGIIARGDPPPGRSYRTWSPTSATLVTGDRDAVLIDTFFAVDHVDQLIDWVRTCGRRLTAIYATHGHGDHFFGAGTILRAFPQAAFLATVPTIERMRRQLADHDRYDDMFPGQLVGDRVVADPVPEKGIELEGERLVPVDVGFTDTDSTTILHVPTIATVIAGDVVYNGVHLSLAEGGPPEWQQWLSALDRVEALKPDCVICGHKRPGSGDSAAVIGETRSYIEDFTSLFAAGLRGRALFDAMLLRHPNRMNVGALWRSVLAATQRDVRSASELS